MAAVAQQLQPGAMDQVVVLLKPSTTKDRFGQHVTYVAMRAVAAKITPLSGRELFAAAALQSRASLRVEIWWSVDIDSTWRLEWMGRQYEIVSEPIDTNAKHECLELMCASAPR